MQISPETKRVPATVAGITLLVPTPFTEGYALLANEANAMNQLLIENLRNNIAGKMEKDKKAGNEWTPEKAQAEMDAYASTYQFGARVGGIRTTDPVQRALEDMAEEKVKELLRGKGIKLNTVTGDKMDDLIGQYIKLDEAQGGALRKEAERRVKSVGKIAIEGLSL